MPPTRSEQLMLDELLSDIYRGIETLPDSRVQQATINQPSGTSATTGKLSGVSPWHTRSYSVREYELPASSPLVRQHKQELARLRAEDSQQQAQQASNRQQQQQQQHRSTLKRNPTTSPDSQAPQSLASFVTSTTPENKRRVRIVDHPDKVSRGYSSNEDDDYAASSLTGSTANRGSRGPTQAGGNNKVKYVNTNKLIYHQEQNPDDDQLSYSDEDNNNRNNHNRAAHETNDDDEVDDVDVDGVTRVEYYHTSWLDRQLGRASKRRSSKELNERQVKEKAMIEELKQSLKNGAITLRQSLKGKKSNSNTLGGGQKNRKASSRSPVSFDDYIRSSSNPNPKYKQSSVFGSGLATIPRNYHNSNNSATKASSLTKQSANRPQPVESSNRRATTPKQTSVDSHSLVDQLSKSNTNFNDQYGNLGASKQQPREQYQNYSKTLPHNSTNRMTGTKRGDHQLLQTHYRNTGIGSEKPISSTLNRNLTADQYLPNAATPNSTNMRYYNSNTCNTLQGKSPLPGQMQNSYEQQRQQQGETISDIPSATEVVRSALSRSNSQVSLNQLNKTINLVPNSPPLYNPSPTTPTQQLKAASPSLSPSPSPARSPYSRQNSDLGARSNSSVQPTSHYSSRTLDSSDNRQQPALRGTRILAPPNQQQQPQQQQPVYTNPHTSLMQHRMNQQVQRQPGANVASMREFNELDSLLKSLSPSSTHITPGYTSKPVQPTYGFGSGPSTNTRPTNSSSMSKNVGGNPDLYARVQKQQPSISNNTQQYLATGSAPSNQSFTIDVSNKNDENCMRNQNLSEFEPPIEIIPSMEDYQNISKLNPVKNHYWYKPNMTRDRAISLLKDKPQGTFIVRDSTSFKGAYGLAVKVAKLPKNVLNNASLRNPDDPSSELIRHFLIEPTSEGVKLKGYSNEPVFGSLPSLIYQHSLTELALPCKLIIPRADIEDPRFNQKQKQFFDDFLASKELAKHNPSRGGGYRKYPGDVYIHNEHRIIFE